MGESCCSNVDGCKRKWVLRDTCEWIGLCGGERI